MLFRTHIAFGFLVGLILLRYLNPTNQILFILLIVIGASIPDIDHPRSKLGKYLKPINFLFEHRGFFHSFLMLFIIYFLVHLIKSSYALPLSAGFFSHIVSDGLTKQGVMPIHPFSRIRIKGFVETGSILEHILFIVILIANITLLINF